MVQCKLSVRDLVEFVWQGGDLVSQGMSIERANLGSRIHRMLQQQGGENYASEVYLHLRTELDGVQFDIEGRADGIRKEEDGVTIEEIKTTAIPFTELSEPLFVHSAQAFCYGHMYLMEHADMDELTIQLTYYHIETKEIKTFPIAKTRSELAAFYKECLLGYLKWAKLSQALHMEASITLKQLQFPFASYRPGQREFAVAVYKTILAKQKLFAQAPTGIGKTISTLFPALKALGEGKVEKIFYLCAKNITASVAHDTLQLLYQQPVHFKTVSLTAKDKICFLEERNCDPKECPYAKGYYDRNKEALYALLQEADFLDKERICAKAKEHTLCPFELSLDASLYADVIVCDYNYAFDPKVYLKRFFMEKGNYVFLVDEAHNLVDRAREMYSTELRKSSFLQAKRCIPAHHKALRASMHQINQVFLSLRKTCVEQQANILHQQEPFAILAQKLESFIEHMDAYLQSEHEEADDEQLKELYFSALNWQRIADYYDEHFVTYYALEQNDVMIRQYCMNPTNPLHQMCAMGRSTIFFSATLSPIDYYLDLLSGDENSLRLSLPSPFPGDHRELLICDAISTRYKDRTASISPLVRAIHAAVSQKQGNYIVFAPSYAYMKQIADAFCEQYANITTHIQTTGMNEEEKQAFLSQLETTTQLQVFFCVLGGMFSEGIDLKGERLIGTIIIGVGLPQISYSLDLIKEHFQEEKAMGYAYAYQFPGMNKVLQAAGRVIRSVDDYGIILLIDERFTTPFYQRLLPSHFHPYRILHYIEQIQPTVEQFWQGVERKDLHTT